MKQFEKYIVDGIDICKIEGGYRVFTVPTQHFNITDLSELTVERFEQEVQKQIKYDEVQSKLFNKIVFETESLNTDIYK